MTNIIKLKAKIEEHGYSISSFCRAVNLSRPALNLRLRGGREFKSSEIQRICELLELSRDEVEEYFFASEVPVLETK